MLRLSLSNPKLTLILTSRENLHLLLILTLMLLMINWVPPQKFKYLQLIYRGPSKQCVTQLFSLAIQYMKPACKPRSCQKALLTKFASNCLPHMFTNKPSSSPLVERCQKFEGEWQFFFNPSQCVILLWIAFVAFLNMKTCFGVDRLQGGYSG